LLAKSGSAFIFSTNLQIVQYQRTSNIKLKI